MADAAAADTPPAAQQNKAEKRDKEQEESNKESILKAEWWWWTLLIDLVFGLVLFVYITAFTMALSDKAFSNTVSPAGEAQNAAGGLCSS